MRQRTWAGRDFGALIPNSAHIISRNLTPDASGLPIGGDSLNHFIEVIRTGLDPDHLHPPCTGAPNANCIPAPFDGNLLQVMPWPGMKEMSDNDLRAIYEYLSTVPCVQGTRWSLTSLPRSTRNVASRNASATPNNTSICIHISLYVAFC